MTNELGNVLRSPIYCSYNKRDLRYEWDDAKRLSNLIKHGVDFEEADRFDWAEALANQREFDYYASKIDPSYGR